MNHTEYLPRNKLQALEFDQKQSPKVTKGTGKRAQQKQPQQPQLTLPESMVTSNGVTPAVMSFLEVCYDILLFLNSICCANSHGGIGGGDNVANAASAPVFTPESKSNTGRVIAEPC